MRGGGKYQWLDLLRGTSAMLVCANHLRAVMFVDYSALEQPSMLVKLFYFLTGLGSQSVIVFFVLSGFFVGGSVIKRWQAFSYADYMLARLVRLWIVLVPALVLTFFLDQISGRMAPDVLAGVDARVINSGPDGHYSSSPATFVQNLLFLQTVSAPVFGSNGPLWSLSNEFWYYVCFPLIFFLFDRRTGAGARLASAAVIAALGLTMYDKALGFFVWLIGAAMYCLPLEHRLVRPWLIAVTLPLFLVTLTLSRVHYLTGNLDMAMLGLSAGLLIVSLRVLPPMPRWLVASTEWLARVSYTLYLVHFPFVLLVYVTKFRGRQALPDATYCAVFLGGLVSLLLIAHCFWGLFEKHTDSVKSYLLALLHKVSALDPVLNGRAKTSQEKHQYAKGKLPRE